MALTEILNWRQVNDRLSLSGQPTESQLRDLKNAGVVHIINLGPHPNDGALADEANSVATLAMNYIYIPVDFGSPTESDFNDFCTAMANTKNEKTHVHCIYNARVSAFFYRYAKSGHGGCAEDAYTVMDSIWRPGGVWANFIGDSTNETEPHRYAGYDY